MREKSVEAYLKDASGTKCNISFKQSGIEYTRSMSEDCSAIVLRSGVIIPVALGYEELKKRLNDSAFKNGNDIDLTDVTGVDIAEPPAFKTSLDDDADAEEQVLIISAPLRKAGSKAVANFTFSENDIHLLESYKSPYARSSSSIAVKFNSKSKAPFNDGEGQLDMPLDEFQALLLWAKENKKPHLDLHRNFAQNKSKYGVKI